MDVRLTLRKNLFPHLINSRFGHWLLKKYPWLQDAVCRDYGHIYLIKVDKTPNKDHFDHILFCGRCWKKFASRKVRAFDYDSPGYEASVRIWLGSVKAVRLDSRTIRKLAGNLLKFRFRVQNEPEQFNNLDNKQKDSLIIKPKPGDMKILGGIN